MSASTPSWVLDADPIKPDSGAASSSSTPWLSTPVKKEARQTNGTRQFFIDQSGSVGGSELYFGAVQQLLETDTSPEAKRAYFTWDTGLYAQTGDSVRKWIASKSGHGGTDPTCLVKAVDWQAERVYVITDGQIGDRDIVRCRAAMEAAMRRAKLADCVLVMIHTSASGTNLSVPAAFSPFADVFELWNRTPLDSGFEVVKCVSEEMIDVERYHSDPAALLRDAAALEKAIRAATLGRESNNMHRRLCELNKRLNQHFARQLAERLSHLPGALPGELPGQHFAARMSHAERLQHCRELVAAADGDEPLLVQAAVQRLIDANKSTSIESSILFGSEARARPIDASALRDDDDNDAAATPAEYTIEDPVSLDEEGPVLLVRQGSAVFAGLELRHREALIRNPLLVLNDAELRQRVQQRISTAVGVSTAAALSGGRGGRFAAFDDPLTRERIVAVLPLSNEAKYRGNVAHALASIFFASRTLCGNPVLLLAVVWAVLRDDGKAYLAGKPGLMDAFDAHLRRALLSYSSRLTLSGLAVAPIIDRPMIEAVWYCLHAYWVHGDGTAPMDRLRELFPTADALGRLLDLCAVDYDRPAVEHRVRLCRALASMANRECRQREQPEPITWRDELRAQYQPSVRVADAIVFADDDGSGRLPPAAPPLPAAYADLPLTELLGLAQLVDASVKVGAVALPERPHAEPVARYNYTCYPRDFNVFACRVVIDPATMRPHQYCLVDGVRLHWSEARDRFMLEQHADTGAPALSCFQAFHACVRELRRYPEQPQFIAWLAKQQARRGVDTLPAAILDFCQCVYGAFAAAGYQSLSVAEFITRGMPDTLPWQKNLDFYTGAQAVARCTIETRSLWDDDDDDCAAAAAASSSSSS